jgi:probable rRNA maturation factor
MIAALHLRRVPNLGVDVVVEADGWEEAGDVAAAVHRALRAARLMVRDRVPVAAEVSVALIDDAAIRDLNRTFRGQDKPTNVLSFPAPSMPAHGGPVLLGDILVAYQTTRREAEAERKPLMHHLSHLVVHGFLHLAGFDHETEAEAEAMEATERAILATLGIADPYAAREAD